MSELMNEGMTVEEELLLPDIADDNEANECMKAIREAQNDVAYWKNWYKEALRRVTDSSDKIIIENEMRLMRYFNTVPHKKASQSESYTLPQGKLVIKNQDPEYERDDEKIMAWLVQNKGEQYIKANPTLDWNGLKATIEVVGETAAKDGKVIPGLKVIEREPIFKVQLNKEG